MGMFQNKTVLVTGAGAGIGRVTARRFAEEGAAVGCVDLNGDAVNEVAARLKSRGLQAFAIKADISSADDNQRMVDRAITETGRLDVAYLNAAWLPPPGGILEADLDRFDRAMAINLKGCLLGLRAAAAVMSEGGAFVVTSSAAGIRGYPDNPFYSMSKHAVIGLVRSAARDLSARGLRINAICPGGVRTAMSTQGPADELEGVTPDTLPLVPYRTAGFAEHIAEFVLFLSSQRANYITGSVHTIDGGLTTALG